MYKVENIGNLMKAKYLVFITAIISICITYYNIKIVELNNEQNLQLSKIHEERDWKYKLTEFMGKYKDDIFSKDLETKKKYSKNNDGIISIKYYF